MTTTLKTLLDNASSVSELIEIVDMASSISTSKESLKIKGSRAQLNEQAMDILKRLNGNFEQITPEEKAIIEQYSGKGGIGASTNEYYTPEYIAKGAWSALEAYGFKNGNVLEPSAGIGIFSDTKPTGVLMTSVEMDKVSSSINQILHPEDRVINSAFEEFATNSAAGGYDAVIGNPPYGARDDFQYKDDEYKDIALADQYFVSRSIDKAAPGGLIGLVLPTRIVERKDLSKWRLSLSLKAEFLGAHRLPSDTFKSSGTAVVTDLVIWRKHSAEAKDIIDAADIEQLKASYVIWDTWVNGKWFEKDGKRFVNGTQSITGSGQFKRMVVDRGGRTDAQITKSLSHKFDSRIDWAELATVEPITAVYGEGDSRMINGKMMRLEDGLWVSANKALDSGKLDSNTYGVDSLSAVSIVTYGTDGALKLSFSQCKSLYDDLGYACDDNFKIAMRAALLAPEKHQERVFRGIMLGRMVRTLSDLVVNGSNEQIADYRNKVAAAIEDEYKTYGNTKKIKKLSALPAEQLSDWSAFNSSISDTGELSDLLTGSLTKSDAKEYDLSNPDDVLLWYSKQSGEHAIQLEQFKAAYTGELANLSDEELLLQLASVPGVAINSDGSLSQMHRATAGNVVLKLEQLNQAIANSNNPALTTNYQRQIELINQKRTRISINDMKLKLTDKWIPKELMLEFLRDRGYSEFTLGKEVEIDGDTHFDIEYRGQDAVFAGYRVRNGQKRTDSEEAFERQVESYVNSGAVRGGSGNAGKAAVREQVRQLDSDFTDWVASSDYADSLEEQYNNVFNGYIEPEHDTGDLELDGVSGAINFMGYQNATIRRHSEDGCGIIGFGTGLGKTLTGLGLLQYNLQRGRSKRTAVVVPKSVLENWFHESDLFFGEANLGDKVFVGIEPEYDNGKLVRIPVLDENGDPRLDKKGRPITRAKLKVDTSSAKIAKKLHDLTHSRASIVIMTKDVYNSIPMRDATIADNVEEMVSAGLVANSNKYVQVATKHREQAKNSRFRAKYADDGSKKKNQLPYFEDLLFDSVMVDEGHDFRNSYKTGSFGNRLAFMPSVAQADRALDMQIKNNYLKRKNSGRGVYMLTATPAVNSPVDAFNMLSHVVPPDTFARMGITDGDDFIRLFGRTGETAVHKLSGDVETKEALLGFQNLGALRKLFHRYVTVKDIKDVDSEVHIPELEKQTNYVDMSEEQEEIYEELRARAEALSNPDSDEAKEIAEEFPDDSVFAIIRQMDKACTDLDLYNGVVTYRFPKSKELAVRELVESVPTEITVKRSVYDEKAGKFKQKNIAINGNIDISIDGKHVVIVATQELDNVITEAAAKANLSFSHPVAPKYAKFLDNAKKAYLAGGKQLVFTEEKTQHVKLARIISQHVGCDISEIGIINSDTVAGKKGSKVDDSLEEAGLEAIAKEYNSGRYKFVILNKKGEVGINLHHGTTDIHHLTLPFTPASLTQRNGRGARVGSKEATVKVHYYAGKGSFDKFRISKIEQKASWLSDLFNGEEPSLENGDAADTNETAIMLAADPEEAKRRQEAAQIEQEKKLKQEKQRRASIAASRYLQAVDALKENREQLESEFSILNDKVKEQEELVASHQQDYEADKKSRYYRDRFNSTKKDLFRLRENRLAVSKKIERIGGAESAKKRFMPDVEKAIKDGALSEYGDILTAPENYLALNGKVIRNGFTYVVKTPARMWDEKGEYVENTGTVVELDAQGERALCLMLTDNGSASKNNTSWVNIERFIRLADVNQSEQQLISKARAGIKLSDIAHTLSLEQFYQLIEQGDLTRYYNTRGGVAVDNAGKLIHVYEFKDPEYTMLYPDLSDAGMINRLLDAAVKDIESKGRSSLENIMTDYVGIDWLTMVHDRGQSATDEVIQSRMQALFSESEGLFKDKYEEALIGYSQPYESEVQKKVNNIDWEGFVNRGVIRTTCTNALSVYMAAIKEKAVENIGKGQLEAFAAYKALCESDPTRQERLENIADLMRKYKRENDFRSHCDELYPKEDNLAAITVFADITAIGRKEPLTSGSLLFTTANFPNTKTNALWEWSSIFRSFKSSFLQHMDALNEQNKPIVETVPVTELQKEKIDNLTLVPIDFATMEAELKGTGVMVKLNSESMVHQFKRRKTNMPAFGYIGLFDVNGRNGALGRTFAGRANSDNKEHFKALYSADISSEFTGSWWFVPATIDIAALTELLKDEA